MLPVIRWLPVCLFKKNQLRSIAPDEVTLTPKLILYNRLSIKKPAVRPEVSNSLFF